MEHYPIRFPFRGQNVMAQVHHFTEYALVHFTSSDIVNDFTGTIKFEKGKYVPGFIRNKDAKDLQDLTRAIEKVLATPTKE